MTPHPCYESAVDLLGGILRCWAKDAERDAGELRALADFLELPPDRLSARLDVPKFATPRPRGRRRGLATPYDKTD